jgi:hypothetical protein
MQRLHSNLENAFAEIMHERENGGPDDDSHPARRFLLCARDARPTSSC